MALDDIRTAALRAFDERDPAALERTARTLRLALGAVIVAQFLFPHLLPPLFVTFAVPWLAGAPVSVLSRTSYLLGLVPWALLVAMQLAHARLLRRAGRFVLDDAQVTWMTLVPGYNLAGTFRLFGETGRALEELGAPAGIARELRWGAAASVAIGAGVPLEWIYSQGTSSFAVAGTELFVAGFVLLAARVFLLVRLHQAFSSEPVRRALLAPPHAAASSSSEAPPAPVPPGSAAGAPPRPPTSLLRAIAIVAAGAALLVAASAVGRLLRPAPRDPAAEHEAFLEREYGGGRPPSAPLPAAVRVFSPLVPAPAAARPPAPAAAPAPVGAASVTPPERLYGGRTAQWWEERIATLRASPGQEERGLAELTVARARANGLSVEDGGARPRVSDPEAPAAPAGSAR